MMSRLHRLDICMRSFFVQASWNPERMQNVGFLFAIRGPLKRIWRHDAGQFVASCERALSFINTHPYFAPAVMGMTLHVEEKVASGAK